MPAELRWVFYDPLHVCGASDCHKWIQSCCAFCYVFLFPVILWLWSRGAAVLKDLKAWLVSWPRSSTDPYGSSITSAEQRYQILYREWFIIKNIQRLQRRAYICMRSITLLQCLPIIMICISGGAEQANHSKCNQGSEAVWGNVQVHLSPQVPL